MMIQSGAAHPGGALAIPTSPPPSSPIPEHAVETEGLQEAHLSLVSFEESLNPESWPDLRRLLTSALSLRVLTTLVLKDTHMDPDCVKVGPPI